MLVGDQNSAITIVTKNILTAANPSIIIGARVAVSADTATLAPGTILMHDATHPGVMIPWLGTNTELSDVTTELENFLDQVDAICDALIALIVQILAHTHSTDAHVIDGTGQVTAIEAVDTTIDGIVTALAALKTAWTASNPLFNVSTVSGILFEQLSATTIGQIAPVIVLGVVENAQCLIHGGTYPTEAQWAKISRDRPIFPGGSIIA